VKRFALLAFFFLAACAPTEGNCVWWAKQYAAEHPKARVASIGTKAEWNGVYVQYGGYHAVVVIDENEHAVRLIDNGFMFPVPTWVSKEEFSRWFVRWLK